MDDFKTRWGRCVVVDDTIEIQSSVTGLVKGIYEGNKVVFVFVTLVVGYLALSLLIRGPYFMEDVALIGILLAVGMFSFGRLRIYLNDTVTRENLISLNTITAVDYRKPNRIEEPVLVISYSTDEMEKKRLVPLLPEWFSTGPEEREKARQLFTENEIDTNGFD